MESKNRQRKITGVMDEGATQKATAGVVGRTNRGNCRCNGWKDRAEDNCSCIGLLAGENCLVWCVMYMLRELRKQFPSPRRRMIIYT